MSSFFVLFCFFLRSPFFTRETCGDNVMLSDIPHTSIPSLLQTCWPWNILSIHTAALYFLQCPVFPFCYFDVEMFLALNTRETALLVDPENSSSASKQWVALVVGELCSFHFSCHFSSFWCSIIRTKNSSITIFTVILKAQGLFEVYERPNSNKHNSIRKPNRQKAISR